MKIFRIFLPVIILFFLSHALKAETHIIIVSSNQFTPSIIDAKVGDVIMWQWIEGSHTTTCDPLLDPATSLPSGAATWNSPMDAGNPVFSYRITVEGTYNYVCLPHSPAMAGTINVTGPPLLEENFDYVSGSELNDNGWVGHSGTGTFIPVIGGNLSYSGYQSSDIGNMISIAGGSGSREDVNRNFPEVSSGSVYVSFLINVSSASATNDYFLHMSITGHNTTHYKPRVHVRDNAGNLQFGISKFTGTPLYTATTYSYNTTYLLVMKYQFNSGTGTDDAASLYVLTSPSLPSIEPVSPDAGPDINGADLPNAGNIAIRQGSNAYNATLDGIRIATSWNDAPLPVELMDFVATTIKNEVILDWATGGEINNDGFEVQRIKLSEHPEDSNPDEMVFETIGFIEGNGTSNQLHYYRFIDKNLTSGTYIYKLKQRDYNNNYTYFLLNGEVIVGVPDKFELMQNFPNPFNPVTKINFNLPSNGTVDLRVYDINGREVSRLISGDMPAGYNYVDFNASSLSSGAYFYRLIFKGNGKVFNEIRKMMVVK